MGSTGERLSMRTICAPRDKPTFLSTAVFQNTNLQSCGQFRRRHGWGRASKQPKLRPYHQLFQPSCDTRIVRMDMWIVTRVRLVKLWCKSLYCDRNTHDANFNVANRSLTRRTRYIYMQLDGDWAVDNCNQKANPRYMQVGPKIEGADVKHVRAICEFTIRSRAHKAGSHVLHHRRQQSTSGTNFAQRRQPMSPRTTYETRGRSGAHGRLRPWRRHRGRLHTGVLSWLGLAHTRQTMRPRRPVAIPETGTGCSKGRGTWQGLRRNRA
jgi:hypothetical protein